MYTLELMACVQVRRVICVFVVSSDVNIEFRRVAPPPRAHELLEFMIEYMLVLEVSYYGIASPTPCRAQSPTE